MQSFYKNIRNLASSEASMATSNTMWPSFVARTVNDGSSCSSDAESGYSCLGWAMKYLSACICTPRERASFALGMLSVFCWGVAEIPQIITNFREGSTEGVSLLFLMTWVVGDVFNLAGCYLEPSTLPTQFYMALLYTITTLILVGQVIYYNHYKKTPIKILREESIKPTPTTMDEQRKADEDKTLPKPTQVADKASPIPLAPTQLSSSPISYSRSSSQGRDGLYYTSARSLASSRTPTAGSYLAVNRGSPLGVSRGSGHSGAYSLLQHNSLEDTHTSQLRISLDTSRSAPVPDVTSGSPVLRAVISFATCVGGLNIGRGLSMTDGFGRTPSNPSRKSHVYIARKLLQVQSNEMSSSSVGVWFGWIMAAIYMGGRLPQIILNIKRGTVEGLNPLMFTFAVLGNATYVGSILVDSIEWTKIKSNMPWLVDAGVCVLLDFFILCQFLYYWIMKSKDQKEDLSGEYKVLQ